MPGLINESCVLLTGIHVFFRNWWPMCFVKDGAEQEEKSCADLNDRLKDFQIVLNSRTYTPGVHLSIFLSVSNSYSFAHYKKCSAKRRFTVGGRRLFLFSFCDPFLRQTNEWKKNRTCVICLLFGTDLCLEFLLLRGPADSQLRSLGVRDLWEFETMVHGDCIMMSCLVMHLIHQESVNVMRRMIWIVAHCLVWLAVDR